MKFNDEQLNKAKTAKSAEELLAIAKENGIEMTADEAAKFFADLKCEGEVADDELANVSGGCGEHIYDGFYEGGDVAKNCAKYNNATGTDYACASCIECEHFAITNKDNHRGYCKLELH